MAETSYDIEAHKQSAKALERNADAIASKACEHLLEHDPGIEERLGAQAKMVWLDHLIQKTLELSAAVLAKNPEIFRERLTWSVEAMRARKLRLEDLDNSYDSLRYAVIQSLAKQEVDIALACMDEAISGVKRAATTNLGEELDLGTPFGVIAHQYIQAVVIGNVRNGIDIVIDAVDQGISVEDAMLKILFPAQREVGRLWHLNQLSVGEEHIVTHATQRLLPILAQRVTCEPDNGFTIVSASVSGNAHDLGIRTISYLFEFAGWKTIHLGGDVPSHELPVAVNCFDADLVLLSIGLSSQLASLRKAIKVIRSHSLKPVKIIVGGNGFIGAEDLWKDIGADSFALSASDALEVANRLLVTRAA